MVLVVNISLKFPIYFTNEAVEATKEPNEPFWSSYALKWVNIWSELSSWDLPWIQKFPHRQYFMFKGLENIYNKAYASNWYVYEKYELETVKQF